MPDIRYIVVSDLHLGAENSVLSNLNGDALETDATKAGEVLTTMVQCLRDVVSHNEGASKPILVLNGDIMELALTSTNNAAMTFQRFVELAFPPDGEFLFDKNIYYLAGNHDHNLWERWRNVHYNDYLKSLKPGEPIRDEFHTTRMTDPEPIAANLLNVLLHQYPHLQDVSVTAAYPAHAVLSEDKKQCVIFCHGHYVESMYSLMTSMRSRIFPDRQEPANFEELERENYAWVDFFWSTLGRSGSVGKDINLIYDKIQDPEQVKIMLHHLAQSFTAGNKNMLTRWVETEVLQELLNFTVGRLAGSERNEPDVVLTPDATTGLQNLMEHYVMERFRTELNGLVPPKISFIFGHTHKPYCREYTYPSYANPVNVYNSGGWVVDTMKPQPLHGGSIVMVDEHFDVVALQMYREGKYTVTLEDIPDANNQRCPFYQHLERSINMTASPWSDFAVAIQKAVEQRHRNLARIAESQ